MRGTIGLAALFGLVSLGGCLNSTGQTPEWFAERSVANDSSFPPLRSVPRTTIANTDAAHWATVEQELLAARDALKASPRAQPPTAGQDPAAFVEEAQQDLEETRQSHEQ